MSEPNERNELDEATQKYVDWLKLAYPDTNDRDLCVLVLQVARQRVEEAER